MRILVALLLSCLICSSLHAERLVIGTSPFDPPMESQATKDNVFTGFEIDLVNEVCRRINASCVFEPMTFADIMKAVAAGNVDLGIDGFFITQERLNYFLFSQPYLQTKAQLFTTTNSGLDINNINGKRVAIEAGTVYKAILETSFENVQVIEYSKQQDMLQDLADQEVDFIMFDFISASYWVNSNPTVFKLVGPAMPFGLGYGIMANLNSGPLIARINSALNAMQNDGTYLAIYSRYF
jgi:arginine transport system substrate-binding protein